MLNYSSEIEDSFDEFFLKLNYFLELDDSCDGFFLKLNSTLEVDDGALDRYLIMSLRLRTTQRAHITNFMCF